MGGSRVHIYPEFCRATSNVQRQTSNDLQMSVVSCWVVVVGEGVQQKGKKISRGVTAVPIRKPGGRFPKNNLQRKMYIVPEAPEYLVSFVPSQKQTMEGLRIQNGRLINNRPDSMTGIDRVAQIKKAMKREEKISMMTDAMRRKDTMDEFKLRYK